MGFREESWQQVRDNITVVGNRLESAVNGQSHIYGALERALVRYSNYDLDVVVVSYGQLNPHIGQLVERLGC